LDDLVDHDAWVLAERVYRTVANVLAETFETGSPGTMRHQS
jgi:hypothetical protein